MACVHAIIILSKGTRHGENLWGTPASARKQTAQRTCKARVKQASGTGRLQPSRQKEKAPRRRPKQTAMPNPTKGSPIIARAALHIKEALYENLCLHFPGRLLLLAVRHERSRAPRRGTQARPAGKPGRSVRGAQAMAKSEYSREKLMDVLSKLNDNSLK